MGPRSAAAASFFVRGVRAIPTENVATSTPRKPSMGFRAYYRAHECARTTSRGTREPPSCSHLRKPAFRCVNTRAGTRGERSNDDVPSPEKRSSKTDPSPRFAAGRVGTTRSTEGAGSSHKSRTLCHKVPNPLGSSWFRLSPKRLTLRSRFGTFALSRESGACSRMLAAHSRSRFDASKLSLRCVRVCASETTSLRKRASIFFRAAYNVPQPPEAHARGWRVGFFPRSV